MASFVDYYSILNISITANSKEIKSKYRKLAIKNHPDRNPNDISAKEKIQAINQAYNVLGNQINKIVYDEERLKHYSTIIDTFPTPEPLYKTPQPQYIPPRPTRQYASAEQPETNTVKIKQNYIGLKLFGIFGIFSSILILWASNNPFNKQLRTAGVVLYITAIIPFLLTIEILFSKVFKSTSIVWSIISIISLVVAVFLYEKINDAGIIFFVVIFLTFPSLGFLRASLKK